NGTLLILQSEGLRVLSPGQHPGSGIAMSVFQPEGLTQQPLVRLPCPSPSVCPSGRKGLFGHYIQALPWAQNSHAFGVRKQKLARKTTRRRASALVHRDL